jgi:hypothetical protein
MDIYVKLPGHAGASRRTGYRQWMEVDALHFERPLLERDPATFTIIKTLDALSEVFAALQRSGRTLSRVRVHRVEGNEAFGRLRFEQVTVRRVEVDGTGAQAMERVCFSAARWQPE